MLKITPMKNVGTIVILMLGLFLAVSPAASADDDPASEQQAKYDNMVKMYKRWKDECERLVILFYDTQHGIAGKEADGSDVVWDKSSSTALVFACEAYERYGHDMWNAGRLKVAPSDTIPDDLPYQ